MRNKIYMILAFMFITFINFSVCNDFQDDLALSEYKDELVSRLTEARDIRVSEKLMERYRSNIRRWIVGNAQQCPTSNFLAFRAWVEDLDNPKDFFCDKFVTKLSELPQRGDVTKPWSANYWAIKQGGLSFRYSPHNRTKNASTWKEYVNLYHQPEDHERYYNTTDWEYVVNMMYSPSEKYDLLVGDFEYTLTNKMKKEGENQVKDAKGDIPGWYGKCHGWTPAAIFEPRPLHTVNITAADGKTVISFYPEDIKALATNFWAEAKFETKFMGNRCPYANYSKIPADKETGLWDDYSCFTVNPATLVIVLSNQLGIRKKSLVYDPDSNGEIWNQPVYTYNFTIYNPVTLKQGSVEESKVKYSELKENTDVNRTKLYNYIKKNAGPKVKHVVGINMTVGFIFENRPVFGGAEAQLPDNTGNKTYEIFLELDHEDNIVGGEWASNHHPIFIWNPAEGADIRGIGDDVVPKFDGTVSELNALKHEAIRASRKNAVLKAIMKYFVAKSSSHDSHETPSVLSYLQ